MIPGYVRRLTHLLNRTSNYACAECNKTNVKCTPAPESNKLPEGVIKCEPCFLKGYSKCPKNHGLLDLPDCQPCIDGAKACLRKSGCLICLVCEGAFNNCVAGKNSKANNSGYSHGPKSSHQLGASTSSLQIQSKSEAAGSQNMQQLPPMINTSATSAISSFDGQSREHQRQTSGKDLPIQVEKLSVPPMGYESLIDEINFLRQLHTGIQNGFIEGRLAQMHDISTAKSGGESFGNRLFEAIPLTGLPENALSKDAIYNFLVLHAYLTCRVQFNSDLPYTMDPSLFLNSNPNSQDMKHFIVFKTFTDEAAIQFYTRCHLSKFLPEKEEVELPASEADKFAQTGFVIPGDFFNMIKKGGCSTL